MLQLLWFVYVYVYGLEYWFGCGGCCWNLMLGYGFGDEIGEMVFVYP